MPSSNQIENLFFTNTSAEVIKIPPWASVQAAQTATDRLAEIERKSPSSFPFISVDYICCSIKSELPKYMIRFPPQVENPLATLDTAVKFVLIILPPE